MSKEIIILFGEMGVGKSYTGKKLLHENFGFRFFEGDDAVPQEMIDRVRQFKPLSKEIVDNYITNYLAPEILKRASESNLIVAQALYLNEHRLYLKKYLESFGFKVTFRWVKVPFWQNLKQLYSRPRGIRWVLYWLLNKPFFEKPRKLLS